METAAKSKQNLWVFGIAIGVLLGLFFLVNQFRDYDKTLVTYSKYEKAPNFRSRVQKIVGPQSLQSLSRVSLDDLEGNIVLLHFFASWCKPCREEKPFLDELVTHYQDGTMTIVGFATYESPTDFFKSGLLDETPFTVLTDEEGTIAQAYKIRAIPQSVLIDSQGHIRYRVKGPLNRAEINGLKTIITEIQQEAIAAQKSSSEASAPQL